MPIHVEVVDLTPRAKKIDVRRGKPDARELN